MEEQTRLERILVVLLVAIIALAILAALLLMRTPAALAAELEPGPGAPQFDWCAAGEFVGIVGIVLLAAMWMGNHKR
jgi:hypothetical protein